MAVFQGQGLAYQRGGVYFSGRDEFNALAKFARAGVCSGEGQFACNQFLEVEMGVFFEVADSDDAATCFGGRDRLPKSSIISDGVENNIGAEVVCLFRDGLHEVSVRGIYKDIGTDLICHAKSEFIYIRGYYFFCAGEFCGLDDKQADGTGSYHDNIITR